MFDVGNTGLRKKIVKSFRKVKEEFDNHLDTINENTNEIQMNYEYMCEIDSKVQKLSERLDEFQCIIEDTFGGSKSSLTRESVKLSRIEQQMFLMFYTLPAGKTLVMGEIARRLGITQKQSKEMINSLISKEIPVLKVSVTGKNGYFLDENFKSFQAQNNIVKIGEKLIEDCDF